MLDVKTMKKAHVAMKAMKKVVAKQKKASLIRI